MPGQQERLGAQRGAKEPVCPAPEPENAPSPPREGEMFLTDGEVPL